MNESKKQTKGCCNSPTHSTCIVCTAGHVGNFGITRKMTVQRTWVPVAVYNPTNDVHFRWINFFKGVVRVGRKIHDFLFFKNFKVMARVWKYRPACKRSQGLASLALHASHSLQQL